MSYDGWGGDWGPYVSVGERQRMAARERARLEKAGRTLAPVVVEGRAIARTFWGVAWCDNLESYSDFESRLPRGRSYVRNGSVMHLAISPGRIEALVCGSSVYTVDVSVAPVPKARWTRICQDSAGAIDSLVELLRGRFSRGVMERLCRQQDGLFPSPREITFQCSCPDSASMCKHVAAVLYGVGARLDAQPELLFRLRAVNEHDLIAQADGATRLATRGPSKDKVLANADLSALFGVPMAEGTQRPPTDATPPKRAAGAKRTGAAKAGPKAATKKTAKKPAKTAHAVQAAKPAKAGKAGKATGRQRTVGAKRGSPRTSTARATRARPRKPDAD